METGKNRIDTKRDKGTQKGKKLRAALLFGGCSDEYAVSLKSASAMLAGMDREKYEIITVGITKDGTWLRYEGEPERIKEDTWAESGLCVPAFFSPSREFKGLTELREGRLELTPVDVVLPALHGKNGEDGTVQGLLDMAGIPYAGCGILASAAGMDKDAARRLAESAGVSVARAEVFHRWDDVTDIARRVWKFQYPLYVKPACGGSSIGISKVDDPSQLLGAVKKAFEHDGKILIEENVPGFEVGCAVIGTRKPFAGAVDELQLHGGVFDYTEKYNMTKTVHHVPARIPEETAERIREAAVKVYRAMECGGIARVDFFLTPDGTVVFNEINTMPGFTAGSRCPKMLMAAGLSFSQIIDRLIDDALERADRGAAAETETAREAQSEAACAAQTSPCEENLAVQTVSAEENRKTQAAAAKGRTENQGLVKQAAFAI